MIIPIRCFTCGKVIAHKWETYEKLIKIGKNYILSKNKKNEEIEDELDDWWNKEKLQKNQVEGQVLDKIGMTRYCCRRMFLGETDLISKILDNLSNQKKVEIKVIEEVKDTEEEKEKETIPLMFRDTKMKTKVSLEEKKVKKSKFKTDREKKVIIDDDILVLD